MIVTKYYILVIILLAMTSEVYARDSDDNVWRIMPTAGAAITWATSPQYSVELGFVNAALVHDKYFNGYAGIRYTVEYIKLHGVDVAGFKVGGELSASLAARLSLGLYSDFHGRQNLAILPEYGISYRGYVNLMIGGYLPIVLGPNLMDPAIRLTLSGTFVWE